MPQTYFGFYLCRLENSQTKLQSQSADQVPGRASQEEREKRRGLLLLSKES
jgi:hypothetical protein